MVLLYKIRRKIMLSLKNIVKDYKTGDTEVHALRGIDIEFRENEFVAILGPSGCGKTTLLNIIGGLDRYTSGDLIINCRSTKEFKDRDWDTYRNHSVGFVFQSYNLIPHQTVLSNVELALTLSGVPKAERRKRAIEALEKVGLGDQLKKKPNQMSGGQMQRVAIARALVNDPDILLADEPTGALDSETSVQIMELLKQVAKDKLVVMVTHNPELAEKYSTRTIKLFDGKIISDSAPYESDEKTEPLSKKEQKKVKKPSMSFFTALALSRNNLITKKGRTILTAFAGSIGIIGIALILSVSTGVNNYIAQVQEDTLTSYPITIEAESVDMTSMLSTLTDKAESGEHENDKVYANSAMYEMMNKLNNPNKSVNDTKSFREFLEGGNSGMDEYLTGIRYGYNADLGIYTKDATGSISKSDIQSLMQYMYGDIAGAEIMATYYDALEIWSQLLPGENGQAVSDVVKGQYDVVAGSWPENYDEVVLVLSKNNEINDFTTYALGLKTLDKFKEEFNKYMDGGVVNIEQLSWSYEDIMNISPKLILASDCYTFDAESKTYTDLRATEAGLEYLYSNKSTSLKIVGIIKPREDAAAAMIKGGLAYTSKLTDYVIENTNDSQIVRDQLENKNTDILKNLPFPSDEQIPDAEKISAVTDYLSGLSDTEKAVVYISIMSMPSEEEMQKVVGDMMQEQTRESMEQAVKTAIAQQMQVEESTLDEYIADMSDGELKENAEKIFSAQYAAQYAAQVKATLSQYPTQQLCALFDNAEFTNADYLMMYEYILPATLSDSTYEKNLEKLGYVDPDSPDTIDLYISTFADKDKVAEAIERYNEGKDEQSQIKYTDYIALLMSSVTTIISAISYVLMAFVAISLIVSSIMIGIITYISVIERTKEIGILRSIGASKRDISRVFNAETFMVGLSSGVLGIAVTLLLCIPTNAIIHHLTGIGDLSAALPAIGGIILVVISVLLTMIAGLLPAKIAAKKDPVEALRSE